MVRETAIVVANVLSIPKLARSGGETACQPRRVLCRGPRPLIVRARGLQLAGRRRGGRSRLSALLVAGVRRAGFRGRGSAAATGQRRGPSGQGAQSGHSDPVSP